MIRADMKKIAYFGVILIIGTFYFQFFGGIGYELHADSIAFLEYSEYLPVGYAIYPKIIGIFRFFFGEESFLQGLSIFQGILGFCTTLILSEYLRRRYEMGYIYGIVLFICGCTTYGFSLPEYVLSHAIMTEAISVPIFMLYVTALLGYILDGKRVSLLGTVIWGIILVFTRSQLLVIVAITVLMVLIKLIIMSDNSRIAKNMQLIIMIIALIVVIPIAFRMIISNISNTKGNAQLIEAIAGKTICVMREEDAEDFAGSDRELFLAIYNNARDNGHLARDLKGGIFVGDEILYHSNENVREHIRVVFEYYADKINTLPEGQTRLSARNRIIAQELEKNIKDYLVLVLKLMPMSLVASIFIQPDAIRTICYILTAVIYIIAIAMSVYLYKIKNVGEYAIPMLLSLYIIILNALACNVILFGQQRYVIYCFGLFYMSLVIMAKEIFDKSNDRTLRQGY